MQRPVRAASKVNALTNDAPVRVIVLAGGKANADPLAKAFGASHRGLIPLAGRPLIAHVLQTAALHPAVESLAVSVEATAFDDLFDVLSLLPGRGIVKLVEAKSNLAESVIAAAEGWDGPLLITTADHALLSGNSIDVLINALRQQSSSDPARPSAAIGMVSREAVLATDPDGFHQFHHFSDGDYASCNLYAVSGQNALHAADLFRGGGRFAGNPWRVLRAFGIGSLLLWLMRSTSLQDAMFRVSKRLGLRVIPVMLNDGKQALDVDDARTYTLAEELLQRNTVHSKPLVTPEPIPQLRKASH